jgi:cytoskeletal protein CcmA (bactofilin family)
VWKKKENELPTPEPVHRPEPPAPRPAPRRAERAVIGPTLKISGEVSGEEEILVQGRVDGKISVKGQGVIVGKSGKVKADIHARNIRVEGQVKGDLFGEQEVIIETSGDVEGNLIAPSVRLENGSRFKGSIDMERAKQTSPQPLVPKPSTANPMPAALAGRGENPPAKSPAPGPEQRNRGS